MESVDFKKIEEFMNYINQNGGRSFDRINELKNNGELDHMMYIFGIDEAFKNIFIDFINRLEDPLLNNYPHYRKVNLYTNSLLKCFNTYGYEFSSYLNNIDAYRNFILFFQSCSNKFGYNKYANMPINELDLLLNNYLDLIHQYRNGKYEVLAWNKYPMNTNKYELYDINRYHNLAINYNDIDDFFIYTEQKILNRLNNNGYNNAIWVSRYYGDGFGYDILGCDPISKKELLVEAKSGLGHNFTISKNEYKTMVNAIESGITDYLIFKSYYDNSTSKESFTTYRYDINNNILVDINNKHNICTIAPTQYYDDVKGKVVEYYATSEKERVLTR